MCIRDRLQSGLVDYVFSTSAKGRDPKRDSVRLRRKAVELSIPCKMCIRDRLRRIPGGPFPAVLRPPFQRLLPDGLPAAVQMCIRDSLQHAACGGVLALDVLCIFQLTHEESSLSCVHVVPIIIAQPGWNVQ